MVEQMIEKAAKMKDGPERDELIGELGRALNPMVGHGPLDKFGPLLLLVIYVGIYIALMFDVVPIPEIAWGLEGILGPAVGIYIKHAGRA